MTYCDANNWSILSVTFSLFSLCKRGFVDSSIYQCKVTIILSHINRLK